MPLDFPTSPTNGQTYNGYVYSTSVGAWQAKPAAQSPFYTSDTPPSNPVAGDSWFNTNDGTMYIYYNDGNTSQWAEHRSQIAKSQVSLVPVVPSSVVVGSGTASVDIGGLVTFTGASSVSLNNVFSNAYSKYKMVFDAPTISTGTNISIRLRTAGTDNSVAYYGQIWSLSRMSDGGLQSNNGSSLTSFSPGQGIGLTNRFVSFSSDIFNPYQTRTTQFIGQGLFYRSDTSYLNNFGLVYDTTTSFDGLTIYCTSGTFDGSVKIFGYN